MSSTLSAVGRVASSSSLSTVMETPFPYFYSLADVLQTVALSKSHVNSSQIMILKMMDWRDGNYDEVDDYS